MLKIPTTFTSGILTSLKLLFALFYRAHQSPFHEPGHARSLKTKEQKSQLLSKGSLKQREEQKIRNDTPPHWTGDHFTALAIVLHLQRAGKIDAITADSFE